MKKLIVILGLGFLQFWKEHVLSFPLATWCNDHFSKGCKIDPDFEFQGRKIFFKKTQEKKNCFPVFFEKFSAPIREWVINTLLRWAQIIFRIC